MYNVSDGFKVKKLGFIYYIAKASNQINKS
jgi:hypothetical protein